MNPASSLDNSLDSIVTTQCSSRVRSTIVSASGNLLTHVATLCYIHRQVTGTAISKDWISRTRQFFSFFRPSVIKLPSSQYVDSIRNIFSSSCVDGFEEFESTFDDVSSGSFFFLGIYSFFFPFLIPQTFSFQPGAMPLVVAFAVGEC